MWPNCCCCDPCNHDAGGTSCCACVPKRVCFVFYDDDEFTLPTQLIFDHDSDGHYTPIKIQTGPDIWLGLELEENESGDCQWRLWTASTSAGTSPTQEDETLTTVANVGCLTDQDNRITVDPWTHLGVTGTVILKPRWKIAIPTDENGKICEGCDCFDACHCIGYLITHYEWTEDEPPELDQIGQTRRYERTCWDPDKGDHGGWEAVFTGHITDGCSPGKTILIELEDDGTGACELVLTDGDTFDRSPATSGVTDCDTDFVDIYWEVWPDALTRVRYYITESDCEDQCAQQCCEWMPDELCATIEADNNELIGTNEITLTRASCESTVFTGSGQVEWDCGGAGGEGAGYGTVSLSVSCQPSCQYSYDEQDCLCAPLGVVCDDTADPPTDGCMELDFSSADFECYVPADCDHGSIGSESNNLALCGVLSARTYSASCNPIIAMHRLTGPAGVAGCLDRWNITITETC